MVPAEVLILEKLPVLGSGKIDNLALTNFVRELDMGFCLSDPVRHHDAATRR